VTDADADAPTDDAAVDEEDAEVVAVDAAAETGARRRPGLLPAIAFVLVLAVLSLAVLATVQRQQLASERDDREEIERVSGELATALLTYDFEHLDASRDRVLARATGKFRKEYETAFDGGLRTLITQTKAKSRGTVTDIYVGDVEDGAASVIVVANAVADGTGGRRASLGSYIQLDLVEVAGRWRVDGVTNLTFGGGSRTTPTTAGN
jgi:Mce-associated membrane protein